MIVYRYGPYNPEEDESWNSEELMGFLSEMLLRYDMNIEEALRMLLNRGQPVNLFIKEGGLADLIHSFLGNVQQKMDDILHRYSLEKALSDTAEEIDMLHRRLAKKLKKNSRARDRLERARRHSSPDELFRLKWEFMASGDRNIEDLDALLTLQEEYDIIYNGSRKYSFRGDEPLNRQEALVVLKQLDELGSLRESLKNALENGDLFNFNLEKLARYLGAESYQEFLERREKILEKLKELLEKQGVVVRQEQSDALALSPDSIRKIGRIALTEIFSYLKPDLQGGSHQTYETGESENLSARTRPMEHGDSFSAADIPASIVNSIVQTGQARPRLRDMEIFEGRGSSQAATVVLLDMSGSMMRGERFYNAKKVVLALDSLIRSEYRDDRMTVVGFGSLARMHQPSEIPGLQPYPVTMYDPHIRLRIDLGMNQKKSKEFLPLYFTNLQRGLELSRNLLGSRETKNKQIILITDGVPTSHFEGNILHINYPPSPADFEAALREVRRCSEEGIVINTFLMTSDWELSYFDEEPYIQQFARQSLGRIFYSPPGELNKMILVDFIAGKKKQFRI